MNNYAIARVFQRIGDLMEIKGENPFKIRAYRTAAQAMQELTESLEVLSERGELREIPGIGDAIAAKTRDILTTGTTPLYERLKEEVPESLIDVLSLPGFGAKKIQLVWQELGVKNLDDLERVARAGKVRDLQGMGAKTEEKLIASIEAHRRRRERTPIGEVLPYSEGLARLLRETGSFERVEVAGSLRRMKDTVGDLNLVAAAADPAEALDAFLAHAEVGEVVSRDAASATVVTRNGIRAGLHVATPDRFGQLLAECTGSTAHLEQLAGLRDAGPPLPPAPDEETWYQRHGLPWIPPELREGTGEVEAAREGRLPRLVEAGDIRGILHAHSTWSDGSASIERMAAAARALGYAFHGNTDHSRALTVANGLDPERLEQQMAEIDALNATLPDGFRVLKGIECDILLDGTLDLPLELLDRLDVVIASVHSHQRLDEETMTRRILRALETGVVDILAHPTGRLLGHRDPYPVDMERVMDAAIANQVALEINAFPDRLDLNEVHARRARERGIPISINTDAHRPEHLSMLRYGIGQARRAWLEPDDVLNCWTLERLVGWLRNRTR